MKREARTTPSPTTLPDSQPDRPATTKPTRIAALLHVVRTLLTYGRHLADTVGYRATTPGFIPLAACFGTIDLPVILAHLRRGILRTLALERVLLARAARGRDLPLPVSRARPAPTPPAPAQLDAPATPPVARAPAPRPRQCLPHAAAAEFHTPTLQQLEAQIRRRPLGRTIVDICLDLAVVPGFCTGTFWNELFEIMQCHGGSVANLMRERFRREQALARQQDRTPTQGWDWSNLRWPMVRQALGFFIGEPPVLSLHPPTPGAPVEAIASGQQYRRPP